MLIYVYFGSGIEMELMQVPSERLKPMDVKFTDFLKALKTSRPSVSQDDLGMLHSLFVFVGLSLYIFLFYSQDAMNNGHKSLDRMDDVIFWFYVVYINCKYTHKTSSFIIVMLILPQYSTLLYIHL